MSNVSSMSQFCLRKAESFRLKAEDCANRAKQLEENNPKFAKQIKGLAVDNRNEMVKWKRLAASRDDNVTFRLTFHETLPYFKRSLNDNPPRD